MLTLGIDSGTQSTKSIVLDTETGEILAVAKRAYDFIPGLPPGHLEQDPAVWVVAADETVRECLAQLGSRKHDLKAIGVSGQQHGLVALNRGGGVIRPAKLWCDTSTQRQCEQFADAFGGMAGLIELAGNPIPPGYTAPKLLWLKQNEPANYAALDCVLLPHDYLNWWLSGEKAMEFGDASGTGLLDVRTRKWCKQLCDFIDPHLERLLPEPQSSRSVVGRLRDDLRRKWGLRESPVIGAGGGDNMMGAIGTGNVRPGVLTASLGTSGTLYAYSSAPVIDPEGDVAAFCDSTDGWLPLVCTMNVTVATEKLRRLFGWNHQELDEAIVTVPPGADGLLFLPYLNGERTPNLPQGSGVFHGLNSRNMERPHMARAVVEGVTMGLAYGLARLRQLGIEPEEIRLTGGGSQSASWRQICADVFGTPTVTLSTTEGAALGAAIQALWALENSSADSHCLEALTARFVKIDESTRCEPRPSATAEYSLLGARQTEITRKMHAASLL